MTNDFGQFIRKKRQEKKISGRTLAKEIGISAVYQSSIESGKRPAPTQEILVRMADVLDLSKKDRCTFYDFAAKTKKTASVPCDLAEYISNNQKVCELLRVSRDYNVSDKDLDEMVNKIKNTYII